MHCSTNRIWGCFIVLATLLVVAGTPRPRMGYAPPPLQRAPQVNAPMPEREFRALWIATVDNIDWPSKPNLPPAQQKAELLTILDRAARLKFNAVFLQVRPECDALYNSRIEPWSECLTGQMGRSPGFFYDPLSFAITEAHKRGLELHAWFNPYRVRHDASAPASPKHISRARPDLVRQYGKLLLLDPSDKGARDYSLSVIMDVVRRYDIDGALFDDYFYPYPDKKLPQQAFDAIDESNWRRYLAKGGKLSRPDWRRENVNAFVQQTYRYIKAEKPWVRFGISPFGIWRPGQPASVHGLDAYNQLYADARAWLINGSVDYLAPQLYWHTDDPDRKFRDLLKWWNEQNTLSRHVWPGLAQMGEAAEQVTITRQMPSVPGEFFWHSRAILANSNGVASSLRRIYAQPALVPALPWLSKSGPQSPALWGSRNASRIKINWKTSARDINRWVVQKKFRAHWETEIVPLSQTSLQLKAPIPETIAVRAVDRYGNMSPPSVFTGN